MMSVSSSVTIDLVFVLIGGLGTTVSLVWAIVRYLISNIEKETNLKIELMHSKTSSLEERVKSVEESIKEQKTSLQNMEVKMEKQSVTLEHIGSLVGEVKNLITINLLKGHNENNPNHNS